MPLGIDIVELPLLFELQKLGITVARRPADDARRARDQVVGRDHAALARRRRWSTARIRTSSKRSSPGIRENQIVALATKQLYELGSDDVESINAVSGERCNPHPHNFTDRLIRPGDQAFFDIMSAFNGYRTCYYRTFAVGCSTPPQRDAYKQAREWIDASIDLIRPGVMTDEVARAWPKAEEFGFSNEMEAFGLQFGHGLGLALHERPVISRLNSLEHPMEIKAGMVFALETYCPATDGYSAARIEEEIVVTEDRAGDHHALPGARALHRQRVLGASDDDRRPSAASAQRPRTRRRLALYRAQVALRVFEKRAYDLFLENSSRARATSSLGQEAIAAGFAARDAADRLDVRHLSRPRPHARARRADDAGAGRAVGRANGLMAGKGGSMHLTERRARGDGLVRDHRRAPAHRLGAAWSAQYRETDQVAVCFFGDGTTNIGAFHEALNFAAVWKLPVVFVCENNLYMEYTPIADVTAVRESGGRSRAAPTGSSRSSSTATTPTRAIDVARRAYERARAGDGPASSRR